MIPSFVPSLAELPASPDVIVVGAGAAGIAAARRCRQAGLSVSVLEARGRVGGRAVTGLLAGHPVDLGAHWLHAGAKNPLWQLARERGEPVRPAARLERGLFVPGRPASPGERRAFGQAWAEAEKAYARFSGPDRSFQDVLPPLGPWRKPIESNEELLSGRPLSEVSFVDQPPDDLYQGNHFIAGGYGAFLARLAQGLPIRTGVPALALDWSGAGVAVETTRGTLRAPAAIVAVPINVLQAGGVRFSPGLPNEIADAIGAFRVGTYEHVVLHWPDAPLEGGDRFTTLLGGTHGAVSLLVRIDGSDLHYMEFNHSMAEASDRLASGGRGFAEALLHEFFSDAELRNCRAIYATDWRDDPWSRGAWGVLPPGASGARGILTKPVGDRIWFAGEALAGPQWGTVGGAWGHGERAAREVVAAVAKLRSQTRA